jgi:nicotinate phosphoribosyltransferase
MSALNTDLYELTMAAGYFAAQKTQEIATFELSVRRMPQRRNFLVAAGLQQAVEYLLSLRFRPEEIQYLRSLAQFSNVSDEFFGFLEGLRFTGDVFAIPEGTPVFPGEPIAIIRAPIVEAQTVETYLLSTLAFQTTIASKAARCCFAAEGRPIIEFGSRRAHSPEAGVLAGRAAYIAGCTGTSNAEAGRRFGIPVFGTAAHSWTMAFPDEASSFRMLQALLGESTIYLIDTYNTLEGAQLAVHLGRPLWGVRLDSGDLGVLSREVRRILDSSGLQEAKIIATNDLNEDRLAQLVGSGAPIDAFGVGTELATSADSPTLSAVYKLVELKRGEQTYYTAKFSGDKETIPAAKQIYRLPTRDLIAHYDECSNSFKGDPLLRPVVIGGELVEPLPSTTQIQTYARAAISALPKDLHSLTHEAAYQVEVSSALTALRDELRAKHQFAKS